MFHSDAYCKWSWCQNAKISESACVNYMKSQPSVSPDVTNLIDLLFCIWYVTCFRECFPFPFRIQMKVSVMLCFVTLLYKKTIHYFLLGTDSSTSQRDVICSSAIVFASIVGLSVTVI